MQGQMRGQDMLGFHAHVFDDDELLLSRIRSAGGQTAFARQIGVDRTYLNKVLNRKKGLPQSILDALNLRIVYAPVGANNASLASSSYNQPTGRQMPRRR